MARYRRYYRRNSYSDYYNDGYEESPVAVLIFLSLLYLVYKYYTDKVTFWHWISYGVAIIVSLLLVFIIILIVKRNKAMRRTVAEIKSVNTDIARMVEEVRKDNPVSEKIKIASSPTPQAQSLYNALIARGIKCELEKWDGHKHIDLAIPWAKMNIEIDGIQHYIDPKQITADTQRNYYSIQKGFKTLRYPNFVIERYLDTVADGIAKIARNEYHKLD